MLPGVTAGIVRGLPTTTAAAAMMMMMTVGGVLQTIRRREVPNFVLVLQVLRLCVGAGGGGEEALVGHVGVA